LSCHVCFLPVVGIVIVTLCIGFVVVVVVALSCNIFFLPVVGIVIVTVGLGFVVVVVVVPLTINYWIERLLFARRDYGQALAILKMTRNIINVRSPEQ